MKLIKYCTRAELKDSTLAFSEKFTILHKVIANTLNIERIVRNIGLTALIAITLLISASTFTPHDSKVDVVVIDAGHGGHDEGTHGRLLKEKDLALKPKNSEMLSLRAEQMALKHLIRATDKV